MNIFTKIGALVFGIVAVLHLVRLVTHWEVTVDGAAVPMWVSVAGFAIAFALCLGLMRESGKQGRKAVARS